MTALTITSATFRLSDSQILTINELMISTGQSWSFIGSNGSGKSALARALAGELTQLTGQRFSGFKRPTRLSLEQLQKLVEQEWQRNNTDLLSEDEDETGLSVGEMIQQEHINPARCADLIRLFDIEDLKNRKFKYLSTGETRKVLLCQAMMNDPDLLILDEPFDGLDIASRQGLSEILSQLDQQGCTLVIILNRFDDLPDFIDQVGLLAESHLVQTGPRAELLSQSIVNQLAHSEKYQSLRLPQADSPESVISLPYGLSPVIMHHVNVSYQDKLVLHDLSWEVKSGQHWHIVGPNGAGKSTLLSLVTGDHPQSYSNDITLFGRRRGSGETIWDIKRHIGYVSSRLHLDYRVSVNVRSVILSGYFDSIGLYQPVSDRQRQLANEWLALLGMNQHNADQPFHSLSWGQQRLVLIARALVKHPVVLILDEPLQGLDPLNRQLVRRFIDILIAEGKTQLLFVSHHNEDAPACITHRLNFVAQGDNWVCQQTSL